MKKKSKHVFPVPHKNNEFGRSMETFSTTISMQNFLVQLFFAGINYRPPYPILVKKKNTKKKQNFRKNQTLKF